MITGSDLAKLMLCPESATTLSPEDWQGLVGLGRQLGLLGRLYYILQSSDLIDAIPERVLVHLKSAWVDSEKQRMSLIWESSRLVSQFSEEGRSFLVLKGAAYAVAGLPNSFGRIVSDIDLLVSKSDLGDAETLLFANGWTLGRHDSYDDYYYRQWMHELPPFVNHKTGITLDLHHNIRPIIARDKVDPTNIMRDYQSVQGVRVPCLEDLFIHSATHLFSEGEFNRVLRDLFDLTDMLTLLAERDPDLLNLRQRACEFNLARDTSMAMFFCAAIGRTKMSQSGQGFVEKYRPRGLRWWTLKWAYSRVFKSPAINQQRLAEKFAALVLFLRSHLIKMPLHVLLPHLIWKGYKRLMKETSQPKNKVNIQP